MYNITLEKNIFMQGHQTFSLKTILSTYHLQPQIYEQMITEIKSPLQEQSFDLTNDNSYSYEQIPKRPNIPPAPPKSPLAHINNNQFSHTYDSYFIDLVKSRNQFEEPVSDKDEVKVVSPLDYEINVKKEQSFGIADWCGRTTGKIIEVQDIDCEVQVPYRSSNYNKRKPIFKKPEVKSRIIQIPEVQIQIEPKTNKPLQQAIEILRKVQQPELASFLQLMGSLQKELKQISDLKFKMIKDLDLIYERLSQETSYSARISELNDTHLLILRRLHSKNSGEILKKVFGRSHKLSSEAQQHLEKLFSRLNNIEVIINQFFKNSNSLQYLNTIYAFLCNNFQSQVTFKHQLSRLYDSLNIQLDTDGLELIWQECQLRKLDKNEFIEGLSLNNFVVREHQGFQDALYLKGFKPNC